MNHTLRSPRRPAPVITFIAAIASTLAACSSTPASPAKTNPTTGISSTTTAPATPNVTASPTPIPTGGLQVADCDQPTAPQIAVVDAATNTILRWVPGVPATTDPSLGLLPAACTAVATTLPSYDPTLRYTGAIRKESDGSGHAGVVELATGTFTDVSTNLHGTGFTATIGVDSEDGFDSTGTLHFSSNGTSYTSAPPYSTSVAVAEPINITSPHGVRSFTTFADSYVLHLPAGQHNTVGENRYDAGYAPLLSSTPSGYQQQQCGAAQWLGDQALLCYNIINLYGAEYVTDLSKAKVIPDPNLDHCPITSGCGQALDWDIPSSATALLLPKNDRNNQGFVGSPDGTKVAFISTLNETSTLQLITPPSGGVPAAPQQLTISGLTNVKKFALLGWY